MANPETLEALKRAYADTILNTMKEAAARVMVSEKKARGYQQELVRVKDEALHTLLRLKQMFDSKVKELEMISSKQQQKVEELEAQLGEAEDIVGELRMELRELRDELKKFTTQLKSEHDEDSSSSKNSDAAVSVVVPEVSCSIPVEQSGLVVVANGIHNPSLTRINSMNRCSSKDNKDRCHHTLPSILTKRKEADGCAQMIHHAVDRSNMAIGDLSSSVEVRDVNDGQLCLPKVPSCKSVETLEISGCADASESVSCVFDDARDGEDPTMVSPNSSQNEFSTSVSLKTSPPREQENTKKLVISETEVKKEEGKKSCEKNDVSTSSSPLCQETPVVAVDKKRCIKYTFQRKRKKEVVIRNPEADEESRNKKQKTGEESLKPSFTNESSRDNICASHQSTRTGTGASPACTILGAELVNQ